MRHNQTDADHYKSLISLLNERENRLSCHILKEFGFPQILHG